MANAGRVLCGRYRILDALGAGGMASVWRGEQVSTGLPVAIKIILRELIDTPGAIVRFQTEAKAVAQLRSQYVVRLIDYDVDQDAGPFIVMELLEGETLGTRLGRGDRLAPPEVARIFAQVAKGLDHAHANRIVHRDLKPDNIFLARDDDGTYTAKLVDFGVAKVPLGKPSGLTSTGLLVGTVAYMSPEQALGKAVCPRSDLWAMGAIAYECLVGQNPFDKDSVGAVLLAICTSPLPVPSQLNAGVPPQLDAWFARACARDPDERFRSGAEMAAALEPICAPRSPFEPPRSAPPARAREGRVGAGYYVIQDDVTVGPIDDATLKRGLIGGILGGDDLVWRDGWPEWRPASSLRKELTTVEAAPPEMLRSAPGLEAMGARSIPPPQAPIAPAAATFAPDTPRDGGDPSFDSAASYYVTAGDTTVGPVTGELLLRGIEAGRVPESALVWREGWKRWRSAGRVRAWLRDGALLSSRPGPTSVLQDRPGLEAIGRRSMLPPAAPPSQADPDDQGPEEAVFYVFDGRTNVGPISGTLLCRGVVVECVPDTAMVWRNGWDQWRNVAEVVWELAGLRMGGGRTKTGNTGIQVLGSPSLVPPGAPSAPHSERPG